MAQTNTPTPASTVETDVADYLEIVTRRGTDAQLLRHLADLLEAGGAHDPAEPTHGALLDVDVGEVRCIVLPQTRPTATLSPREAEVARMVARGMTNRAIASALDISLWTVSTHLRRIFAKLAVNNRAEMVAMTYCATAPGMRTLY